MRPLGPCAKALLQAASRGPADVVQLAHRAQVSVPVARYTASRMVSRGELSVLTPGRPAVLGLADSQPQARGCELQILLHSFVDL